MPPKKRPKPRAPAPLPKITAASRIAPEFKVELLTADLVKSWLLPDFQRPLKVNQKVLAVAAALKVPTTENGLGGILPGTITLGILRGGTYIVDGQHRLKAFELSELEEAIASLKIMHFANEAEMSEEYANLNDSLVRMSADDRLRAMEKSNQAMQTIRSCCRFVGYGQLWRSPSSPLLSMSTVLRIWEAAGRESAHAWGSVLDMARNLTVESAEHLADFLNACYKAWANDQEYRRLWGSLNMTILGWLWRRTVAGPLTEVTSRKSTRLTKEGFIKCAMALSADTQYLDWLHGRRAESERSPCYARIKVVFSRRLREEGLPKPRFPDADWSTYGGGGLARPGDATSTVTVPIP